MPFLRRDTAVTTQCVCGHDSMEEEDAIKESFVEAKANCLKLVIYTSLVHSIT
jgi:hypothetical protein